jgi:hypothetical protein
MENVDDSQIRYTVKYTDGTFFFLLIDIYQVYSLPVAWFDPIRPQDCIIAMPIGT